MTVLNMIINTFGFDHLLFLVHFTPFGIAMVLWSRRRTDPTPKSRLADMLGLLSIPLMLVFYGTFADDPRQQPGHHSGWFLVLSVISLGIFPALTLSIYFLGGRFVGKCIYAWRHRGGARHVKLGR